jgi:hypothetical protein
MKANISVLIATAIACSGILACGGSSSSGGPNQSNGDDAGGAGVQADAGVVDAPAAPEAEAAPPADNGAPSQTYPAFQPAMGQLQDNGGLVMTKPVIVAITWASDPSAASFNTFADEVGATSYWAAASAEYGVGPAVSGTANHVSMTTAAPASLTETQQAATSDFIKMVAQNAGTTWPAPTDQTIYAFFLPPGTSLLMPTGQGGTPSDACTAGVGGYHFQATVGSVTTSYAVVPSCTFGAGNTAAQQTTMSMSHELLEAATDPHPADNTPGWVGFTNDTFAFDWFQEFADENGDACEFFRDSFFEDQETSPAAFDYWVQRTWSNKAGPLGHDPCQPAPSTPYFNVTPLNLDTVNITLPPQLTGSSASQTLPTKGFHILSGATATFQLGFYSDGPTSGPWTLSYSEGSPAATTKTSRLTVVIDKTSGVNGEKANVTVTVKTVGTLKGELISFKSTLNGVTRYMPVLIGSE